MKININQKLYGVDGVEALKADKGRDLTLRDVCITSILSTNEKESEQLKYERWEIYKKIRDGGSEVELTIEEVAKLKKSIGLIQPPLIMGQCFDLLERQ